MLRLGLIGSGRWGKVYLRTIRGMAPRLRVTGVATSRPKDSWKELVDSPLNDAVIIATPAPLHAAMARRCLERGKPCIVEKPLCFDVRTARDLQRRAEKARLPVLVNHIHLHNPAYRALKRAVLASGEKIRAVLSEGMDLGPFRPDVGTLWDRCPHDVALCVDLLGPGAKPDAFGGLPDRKGQPERVTLSLRWKNGAAAWIQSGRLSAQKKRTLTVVTDSTLFHWDDQDEVRCRKIPFDYSRRMGLGSAPLPKGAKEIPVPAGPTPMEAMLAAFADEVQQRKPASGLRPTVEVTRILEQCQRALSS